MNTPMPIDRDLLTLTQWLSPAYPIGAFAYSHGLEAAVSQGWIKDAAGFENWLHDCLIEGSGRADAIWLHLAHAAADPREVDAQARAFSPAALRQREALRQGAAFAAVTNAVWGLSLPGLMLPVAVGHAAAQVGLDPEATAALYLQSFCANLTGAAQRLLPIGQTEAQGILARLTADCLIVARDTRNARIGDTWSNAFLSDIAAMRHETLETRIFQS